MATNVTGYSPIQVALHWIIAILVAFQFFAHDGIETAWRGFMREEEGAGMSALAGLHIATGVLILVLMLARFWLRMTRGVPPPPADEPRLLQIMAEAVHGSIYVLLILLPVSGAIAWFLGVKSAGDAHELLTKLLLGMIFLHIAGALFQHFVRRSRVLMRMFRPEKASHRRS